ncbi:MAG TPA: alpha-(1-_3)-arabinofuranosyltransferase family protein [Acidimicrobiales bacterium]
MTTSLTTAPRGRHAAGRARGENGGTDGGNGRADAEKELDAREKEQDRPWRLGGAVLLAGLAYIPLLCVRPGVVTPDTKTYLYLDPGRFLSQVSFLWNPTVGLGTVTHEYIGYLLPMGPFYGILAALGVPTWVAQRLWLGTILFLAGYGILYLSRTLRLRGPGPVVAALAYMLSPYFLQYAGRISVILLPWAGLPFMLAFTILALRRGGWRMPALFALAVALVSGINATAIIYVGVAPILWIVYAVVVLRQATWRQAILTALRMGVLSLFACLWWISGLAVEAAYGVNVLKYTETVPSTSATSNASEVIRGLGYWYFYGSDHLGPWTNAAVRFTQDIWLLVSSYAVPILAVAAAALLKWRERAYFILLVAVGMVLSVGPFPFTHPTAIGGVLKSFMTDTTAGLALRSTDRATPVVLLGLAMLLGSGVAALWERWSLVGVTTAVLIGALVVANNPSLFNGDTIANNFTQPASLPSYQLAAIAHLNATHRGTRVLAVPGNDFASYRWGDTVDTPQPAYLTRDFVTREQQIMGSIATADTLYAMDDPIQEDTANFNALAPMARLLSAGDVMAEYDQAYEHYGVPQPQLLALEMFETPPGLTDPVAFGTPRPNVSSVSTLNEEDLAAPSDLSWPNPLITYTVKQPRPVTRAESNQGAVVLSGDATGLVNLAGLGLLNTTSALYYSGTLDKDPARLATLATSGAQLVVTDTNRKQAFRWDTLNANAGATETPAEDPAATDLSDSPIDLFPGAPKSAKTTAGYVGAVTVTASSYGNSVSYTPEDQAYSAIDGNLDTAWITGTFVPDPAGEWWQAQFAKPVTTTHLTLVQPQKGDRSRWVSRVTATFDGKDPVTFDLGHKSHRATGQTLTFPSRTFHTVRLTIDDTTNDTEPPLTASAVGFAEVQIPGQTVHQVIMMPTDLTSKLGASSAANRLTYVMTRQRTSPFPPRTDPETTITREFDLPTARTFTLSGSASLSALLPDDEIDHLVGRATSVLSYSSGRLPGDLRATASATLDGNPSTAWQPGLGTPADIGATLTYNLPSTIALRTLTLGVIADGRHSVPTSLTVTSSAGTRRVAVPAIADSTVAGAVTTVPVSFPALTGRQFVITFTGIRTEKAANYYSAGPLTLPLGIAEIGIPGVAAPVTPAQVPGNCTGGLLSIDGQPIDVAVVGSTGSALDNGELQLVPCGPDAAGVTLAAGTHVVQTAVGHSTTTGWNIDQLVLDSAAGGGPGPDATPTAAGTPDLAATQPGAAPKVTVTASHIDDESATVRGATAPFEFVLGQSLNGGWQAVATPGPGARAGARAVNLGPSELIDSFANGWPVTAADLQQLGGSSFTVQLTWTPQRDVWAALALSGLTLLLCLLLGFLPERARSRVRARLPKFLGGPAAPALVTADRPRLELPTGWRRDAAPRSWPVTVGLGVVTGLAASTVTSGAAGALVAALVIAGLQLPVTRWIARLGALGFIVAGGLGVITGQATHHYLPGSNWAGSFVNAGDQIWVGIVLLLADAVVVSAATRSLAPAPPENGGPSPPT